MLCRNPIIPGFHPDPSVCRVGEDFYLVNSSFEYFPGVPIFHSRDLVHWRQIGHCLTRVSQLPLDGVKPSDGVYAPTIRFHGGRFYMVVTRVLLRDDGTKTTSNFYVHADEPTGEWSEPVFVDQGGIDPSLFFDDDGKVYFTSNGTGWAGVRGAYQCEIDLATGRRLGNTHFVWAGTGGQYPEAPHLFKRAGFYYLMLAEGGTEEGHMVTISRARSPWGPFEPCPHNPLLTHRSLMQPIQATGHADLVEDQHGQWWAVFLGIRYTEYRFHNLGRETFLASVRWTPDGWPVINEGKPVAVETELETALAPHPWPERPARDDFDSPHLDPCWNFLRNPGADDWSLQARPGSLWLRAAPATLDALESPAFVGRRQEHFTCGVAARIDFRAGPRKRGRRADRAARPPTPLRCGRHAARRAACRRRASGASARWRPRSLASSSPRKARWCWKSARTPSITRSASGKRNRVPCGRSPAAKSATFAARWRAATQGSISGCLPQATGKRRKPPRSSIGSTTPRPRRPAALPHPLVNRFPTTMNLRFLPLILLFNAASAADAEVRLPALFSDHMVLQRDATVPVWGRGDAGENVTVEFGGQTKSMTAAADGAWLVKLDAMPASGDPRTLTVRGKNTLTVSDVLVGEVWLCGGQSNMEWSLGNSTGGPEAMAAAGNPLLRLARVDHHSKLAPQTDAPVTWQKPTPGFTKNYSAIAYWFGERLQKELGVPVGIINNSYGGTTIQAWLPLETLRGGPWPQDKSTDFALAKAEYDQRVAEKQPEMDRFLAEKAAAQKEKRPGPVMFAGWPGDFRGPSVLWNGEVAPLLPFRIRGVAWYQGESNAYAGGPATHYREMLLALIRDWRAGFQQPEMLFLIFQIARNRKPQTDPNEPSGIAELQEAQLRAALVTPHTALVVTNDLGEPDVHYRNKAPAAYRAVKAALALAYGRDVKHAGPVLREAKFAEGKAFLRFDHADGGLAAHDGEVERIRCCRRGSEICLRRGARRRRHDHGFQPASAEARRGALRLGRPLTGQSLQRRRLPGLALSHRRLASRSGQASRAVTRTDYRPIPSSWNRLSLQRNKPEAFNISPRDGK